MPLHVAAISQHLKMVELLLSHGADPNAKDAQGSSALQAAKQKTNSEIEKILIQYGAVN